MVEGAKRKKHHDKDKYYRLAKEQGLRSRAAFKLAQINRKFHVLENAKVVLDLCAAPGGWTQIASRTMSTVSSSSSGGGGRGGGGGGIIVAVDILPIRPINRNVITLIGDITTEECHAKIRQTLQTAPVDVVLSDGAPNVGASYDRDAYAQNEIALYSLKCATQHLKLHGTFITKIYRSSDYSSYMWAVRQLFDTVHAVKPASSRAASAEIFLVCLGYKAPDKIDKRLLDPKHVFEQVDDNENDVGDGENDLTHHSKKKNKVTIFHKSFDQKKRNRQGYDMTNLDMTFRNVGTIADFVETADPIQLLTDCTGLSFLCSHDGCTARLKNNQRDGDDSKGQNEDIEGSDCSGIEKVCRCQAYFDHSLTSADIKACVADLKVLNKADFKHLLSWRIKMRGLFLSGEENEVMRQGANEELAKDDTTVGDDEDEEEMIQKEAETMLRKKSRERKRDKKKERVVAAKRRRRAALGLDMSNLDETQENDKVFSLGSMKNAADLEAVRNVEDVVQEGDDHDSASMDNDVREKKKFDVTEPHVDEHEDDFDEVTGYSFRLDSELDEAYDVYLSKTKSKTAKVGTQMAKREKFKAKRKAGREAAEDEAFKESVSGSSKENSLLDNETKAYASLLQCSRDSDDEEEPDGDDDDGFHSVPMTPEEHTERIRGENTREEGNPLIHTIPDAKLPVSVRTARWFSNPLFDSVGLAAHSASTVVNKCANDDDTASESEVNDPVISNLGNGVPVNHEKRAIVSNVGLRKKVSVGLDPNEVLAMMPKTDKQIRHEKRKKESERKLRKQAKKVKLVGESSDFEVVPASNNSKLSEIAVGESIDCDDERLAAMSESQRKRELSARALIKAGLKTQVQQHEEGGFEVIPSERRTDSTGDDLGLPVLDDRQYDSEHEDYDSDDHARTLALGTMMLRRSKAKALVDASYNRYAWNDPADLPDWFKDDETRHYRPQLPIPPELVAKMKARFLALSTKPIAKVVEARARKSKRARNKLAAAKKKAESVVNNSDMSEAMKLRAISKAMRGQETSRPGKTYVVSKKGGKTKGGRGIKLVDKRMKNDKRGVDRASRKKKEGKKGGLTGSKHRRHHN